MPTTIGRPGFCTECGGAIDPDDDRTECPDCTDDVIDLDMGLDEDYPEFDWRDSSYLIQPDWRSLDRPINWDLRPTPGYGKRQAQKQ
jgi:hypothetical protein